MPILQVYPSFILGSIYYLCEVYYLTLCMRFPDNLVSGGDMYPKIISASHHLVMFNVVYVQSIQSVWFLFNHTF